MFKDGKINFKKENMAPMRSKSDRVWKILIVDDEPAIHDVSKLALENFEFDGRRCEFISAFSARQAKQILQEHTNIALALIDVVMETDEAGLELVNYIRNELKNKLIRIILRTGQPGQAPEERVIHDYDINDYKSKNELTTQKLYTSVLTGLRAYRDMIALDKNRQGLRKVIESTSSIEKMASLEQFLSAVLEQLLALLHLTHHNFEEDLASFIAALKDDVCLHVAGSGLYANITNEHFCEDAGHVIRPYVKGAIEDGAEIHKDGNFVLYRSTKFKYRGFVLFMEVDTLDELDKDLIRLFFDKATSAYENASLSEEIDKSQKETIFTMSEVAEQRSNETGKHVRRVALYSKLLAEAVGLSEQDVDFIYAASPMHDIGKLGIQDSILKKPGKLTDDEMEIMKTHAQIGYDMLKSSELEIMQMSATIAKEHHEKYDGSGYPLGLSGDDINIVARIVALADVFDALGSKRVYKETWQMDDILDFVKNERGKHFDPKLVDLFFENIDEVLKIHDENQDS